jgi:hypothetical protein
MVCAMKTIEIKGPVELTFDGMEHMTGKASITTTMGATTNTSHSVTDHRWKAAACTAADVNTRPNGGR